MTKFSGVLPKGQANGLAALAHALLKNPKGTHIVIGVIDVKTITTDVDTADQQATVRFRRVEVIDTQDVDHAVRMMQRAAERRTGATMLPIEVEDELEELLGKLDLDFMGDDSTGPAEPGDDEPGPAEPGDGEPGPAEPGDDDETPPLHPAPEQPAPEQPAPDPGPQPQPAASPMQDTPEPPKKKRGRPSKAELAARAEAAAAAAAAAAAVPDPGETAAAAAIELPEPAPAPAAPDFLPPSVGEFPWEMTEPTFEEGA